MAKDAGGSACLCALRAVAVVWKPGGLAVHFALRRRQHQLGAQASDRRGRQRKIAAVERGELEHDREAEARARLGLVETLAAGCDLLAMRRREARTVVVDDDADAGLERIALLAFLRHLDAHPRLRPFA